MPGPRRARARQAGLSSRTAESVQGRPGRYWIGFFLSLCATTLYGLVLPLVELTYKRAAGAW